jgi:glucosamine-6-phosphate deaminase
LGVGRNGHIGFNEPADYLQAKTFRQKLTPETIADNARFFAKPEDVPTEALTMGMASIGKAKKVMILMTGEAKRDAYNRLVSGNITTAWPVTLLSLHTDLTVLADQAAAGR